MVSLVISLHKGDAMQRIGRISLGCLGVITLLMAGCAGPTRLELDYGTSQELVKMNQTLNPDADQNHEPMMGMDGEAAKNSHNYYRANFAKPKATQGSIVITAQ